MMINPNYGENNLVNAPAIGLQENTLSSARTAQRGISRKQTVAAHALTVTGSSTTLFRTLPPRGKNLLVINKGPGALTIPREGTKWDVMEIYYMAADINRISSAPSATTAEHVVFETDCKMRKFAIIKAVFEKYSFWSAYDSVMMFDDDVVPVGCDIDDIFELFAQTGCRVGQPALTQDSFYGHVVHIKNDNFVWRRANCAELMCPVMTREAIREYLFLFNATVSGFGLDDYWSYHEWLKGPGVAILDRTPVRHGRPVGSGTAYQGLSQDEECRSFMLQHAIPRYPHSCYGGLSIKNITTTIADLGLYLSGYDRRYIADPRFHIYASDQVGILANLPPTSSESLDVKSLKVNIDALSHVAGAALYMATRNFRYTPPAPKPIPAKSNSFWSWLPWWPWW